MHARPEAGAQVGGTCEDVAQTLIPHEFPASLLDQMLHLWDINDNSCAVSSATSAFKKKLDNRP